jgi:hypothetical protein
MDTKYIESPTESLDLYPNYIHLISIGINSQN